MEVGEYFYQSQSPLSWIHLNSFLLAQQTPKQTKNNSNISSKFHQPTANTLHSFFFFASVQKEKQLCPVPAIGSFVIFDLEMNNQAS